MLLVDSAFMPGTYNLDGRSYTWENEYVFPITDENPWRGQHMFGTDLNYAGVQRVDASWFEENVSLVDEAQAWFFSLFSGWLWSPSAKPKPLYAARWAAAWTATVTIAPA